MNKYTILGLLALCVMALASFLVQADATGIMLAAPAVAAVPMDELSAEIKRIVSEFQAKSNEISNHIAKSEEELKNHGKISEETKNAIAKLGEKAEKAEKEMDSRLANVEQLVTALKKSGSDKAEKKDLGALFIESEGFKSFASKQRHKGQSAPLELKDITSAGSSAGDGIWSFRDPEIVSNPYRPRMIRELIPTVPVTSNLVEWVQTNVRTNNAGPVSETGTKPKSDLTYDRKETPVRKIAHYFKTSAEVLADFARLRAEINTEGFEMLRQVEEDQLMTGDGTGINLLGLIPQATDFDIALVQSGDQQVDVIRRAILQVRQSYYSATGIVLNPADWAAIELLKDGENRYLFSNATSGAPARLWGLPVSESDSIPQGEFMVGAFRTAATIYDRLQAAVYVSTENEDDFINNMVSILFEERLALAVKRPLAFVHGALSGSSI